MQNVIKNKHAGFRNADKMSAYNGRGKGTAGQVNKKKII